MAGVAGLEPVTSAVTGQRSNQLSYTPAMRGARFVRERNGRSIPFSRSRSRNAGVVRAADVKEVGVENPAEERTATRIKNL